MGTSAVLCANCDKPKAFHEGPQACCYNPCPFANDFTTRTAHSKCHFTPSFKGETTVPQAVTAVQTTSDKVLAAASQCPQAAAVLKTLFPSVFADPQIYPATGSYLLAPYGNAESKVGGFGFRIKGGSDNVPLVSMRAAGLFRGAGLFLNGNYNWKIVDDYGQSVLAAFPRDKK